MIEGALPQLTNEQNDSTTNTTIYEMDDDTDQLTVQQSPSKNQEFKTEGIVQ